MNKDAIARRLKALAKSSSKKKMPEDPDNEASPDFKGDYGPSV